LTIIAVVAGYEAAYNPLSQPSVWAHYSSLDWVGAPLMDGKIIGSMAYGGGYSMVGELHLETVGGNAHLATVGVFAHEVSHALGLPDLYDTSQQSYGVGNWS
jgi:immune inhibitor A